LASYQIQQLAHFCEHNRIASKVCLVPSVQSGTALGIALARSGTNWINLRFATPEDLAREIAGPQFVADGWIPLPKDADLIDLSPIVRTFLQSPQNVYFKNQSYSQGLLRSIHRTLRALRIAGVSAESLLRQRSSHKMRAIAQLYVAYQDSLEERRWFDGPDLFSAATAKMEEGTDTNHVYAILDETPLPGLARTFVQTLTGGNLTRIGRTDYGVSAPETVAAHSFRSLTINANAPIQPAGNLFTHNTPSDIGNVDFSFSTGPQGEIHDALSRTVQKSWPLDRVEIVCTTPDLLRYAYDTTRKQAIPATFGAGISILQTRPGQATRALLHLVATGAHEWADALTAGRLLNVDEGVSKLIKEALALSTLHKTPVSDVTDLCLRLLNEHVSTLIEIEEPATESLIHRLEQLSSACQADGSATAIAESLLDAVANHRFGSQAPRSGHLNVVPLDRAGFANREHTLILGLDSGSFPGSPGEDPLLLDRERSALSDDIEMLRTRPIANTWHLIRLLGIAPHVTVSASTYSPADGQESEPASIYAHLQAVVDVDPQRNTLLPQHPNQSADPDTWKLTWAKQQGSLEGFAPRTPWLVQGVLADEERSARSFTRFKGIATPPTDVLGGDLVWSASRLETLARCPSRYFWRYVLEIDPPEEERADETKWLSPLDFGSLLHDLFYRFMESRTERATPPTVEQDTDAILEHLQRLIDKAAQVIPPPNPLAFEVDVARLQTAARVFIAEESKRSKDHRPRGFEVSFGFDKSDGLNHPDPVSLPLGNIMVQLRGLIDRVDRTPDGYTIWDYKTGSAIPYDESDLLGGGQHLQWALYAHAFAAMQDIPDGGISSGYYFASDREHGRKMQAEPPSRDELGELLSPVIGLAEAGAYPPIQKTPQCMFCDYKSICEKDRMLPRSIVSGPDEAIDPVIVERATQWLST